MLESDLTTGNVATILRSNRVTVQRLLKTGRLQGYQIGRSWRVSKAAVDEFRKVKPTIEAVFPAEDYALWESALLNEDDLAAAPPIAAEALRRENMYEERS